MAITSFIPSIWSARLLAHLDNAHVATRFVNRDYEGEIRNAGDTVKINQVGAITIKDYTKNTDIADPEALTTSDQTLAIDQAKYFNFQVDDVDAVQAKASLMDGAMSRAAYGLAEVADRYLFQTMAAAAPAGNTLGSGAAPVALTADNVYEKLVELKLLLDKKNLPAQGRCLAVPPELHALMLLDQRFVGTGSGQAEASLRGGLVGRAAGFDIYRSNNLPTALGTDSAKTPYTKIIASHPLSASYAEQILKTEAYRMESRFADGVKGLHVYGAKVLQPDAVAVLLGSFA